MCSLPLCCDVVVVFYLCVHVFVRCSSSVLFYVMLRMFVALCFYVVTCFD